VAEGIENQATWTQLDAMGCDVAQGYFLSRPLTPEAFSMWLEQKSFDDNEGTTAA
jgi:EAL domain-containing protein (putative c-di-GMP-specific phosphodiesterase class I)